jgi:hypothetical protein
VVISQQTITHFSYGNGNADHHLGVGFFIHQRITSAVTRAEYISDRMYITLTGHWCDITALNVDTPNEVIK